MSIFCDSVTLTTISCPKCSGVFAISENYRAEAELLGSFKQCWTCPYCKTERGYGNGKLSRLEEQLASAESTSSYHRKQAEDARREADYFRKSRDGMKGALVKTKKRIGHGVCPCCTRTFTQLAQHMAAKHPEYAGQEAA